MEMPKNLRCDLLVGFAFAGSLMAWYYSQAIGGQALFATAVTLSGLVLAIAAICVIGSGRGRTARAAYAVVVVAIPCLSWVAIVSGSQGEVTRVQENLFEYRALVTAAGHQSLTTRDAPIACAEPCMARARVTTSGQLVLTILPTRDRRGVIYLSNDDPVDAKLPRWFFLRKIEPRWYVFRA